MYTAEDVKKMTMDELIPLWEKKNGRQMDAGTACMLALCHGGGSLNVIDLNDSSKSGEQSLNYEGWAELFNGLDADWIKPYEGPKIEIKDPAHFLAAFLHALENTDFTKPIDRDNPLGSLIDCFQHMEQIALNYAKTGYHFKVTPDFVDHSFYFECYDAAGNRMYNGGIIRHQLGENPPGWSTHT